MGRERPFNSHLNFTPSIYRPALNAAVGINKSLTWFTTDLTARFRSFGVGSASTGLECLLKGLAIPHPVINGSGLYPVFTTPFSKCFSCAVDCFVSVSARIVLLRKYISPPTVIGFVISVNVNAVKLVIRGWFLTHVLHEIFKSPNLNHPTITNLYSPTAVSVVAPVFRVINSLFHSSPGVMFRLVVFHAEIFVLGHMPKYNVSNDISKEVFTI